MREDEGDEPAFSHAWISAVPCGTVTGTPSISSVTSALALLVAWMARDEASARGLRELAGMRRERRSMVGRCVGVL